MFWQTAINKDRLMNYKTNKISTQGLTDYFPQTLFKEHRSQIMGVKKFNKRHRRDTA